MKRKSIYYKPSGNLPLIGAAGALLAMAILVAGQASVYAGLVYALHGSKGFLLRCFLFFGELALLIATVTGVLEKGRSRNESFDGWVGLCAGAWALYVYWAVYAAISTGQLIWWSPEKVWAASTAISDSLFDRIGWGLEAVGIVLAAWSGGLIVADEPYCEQCSAWCKDVTVFGPFRPLESREALVERLEGRDTSVLRELVRVDETATVFWKLTLTVCSCHRTAVLGGDAYEKKVDSDGKTSESTSQLFKNLLAEDDWRQRF